MQALGEYSSEERAIEVLDEIQECMTIDKKHYEGKEKISYHDCSCYKNDNIMIYEMPKE